MFGAKMATCGMQPHAAAELHVVAELHVAVEPRLGVPVV